MTKEKGSKNKKAHILYAISAVALCIMLTLSPLLQREAYAASVETISYTMYSDSYVQLWVHGKIRKGTWKSSDPKIATVSNKGMVKSKSKAGKTVISVKLGKTLYKCNLTVKKDNKVVKLNKSSIVLNGYDESFQLKASTTPKMKIRFYSSNSSVAKVSSTGLITPVRDGKCEITAYVDNRNYRSNFCTVTVKNCPVPALEKTKYKYELYVLDDLGEDGWFHDIERPIFIKTNNPDMKSIDIFNDDWDLCASNIEITGYADLDYTGIDEDHRIIKVPGGYLMNIIFGGKNSAPLYTSHIVLTENGKIAVKAKCTVRNPSYLEKRAVKNIVNTISKEGMTPFDKMQAAVDYIESKNPRYYWNDGVHLYKFATEIDDSLWFYNWKFDSLVTPIVLCEIAREIGGFDKISNLYYEGDWSEHWYAEVTIGNESRRYTFCPMDYTGYIENPTANKLSFLDTSKYTRIY